MSVGFRKGEGKGNNTVGENWQKSKLWNCKKCGSEKIRNKCVKGCDKKLIIDISKPFKDDEPVEYICDKKQENIMENMK